MSKETSQFNELWPSCPDWWHFEHFYNIIHHPVLYSFICTFNFIEFFAVICINWKIILFFLFQSKSISIQKNKAKFYYISVYHYYLLKSTLWNYWSCKSIGTTELQQLLENQLFKVCTLKKKQFSSFIQSGFWDINAFWSSD